MKCILVILFYLTSLKSSACLCDMYNVEYYVNKVDAIFTGKVIELIDSADSPISQIGKININVAYKVRVLVIKNLKKDVVTSDTLEFTSSYSSCDPRYVLGESYLFFAHKESDDKYMMQHCTPWATLKESKQNIKKLKRYIRKTSANIGFAKLGHDSCNSAVSILSTSVNVRRQVLIRHGILLRS